ncbi:flagellar basal body L-ring protein FlgH [Myxococcota bacterium]|nr:flagellar basal body L-ring protein FlgH [Myxococcota bacterium]
MRQEIKDRRIARPLLGIRGLPPGLLLAALTVTAGCRTQRLAGSWNEGSDPCADLAPPPVATADGSLFVASGPTGLVFGEQRARRVCDHVTIVVAQETSASQENVVETGRQSEASLGVSALAGLEKSVTAANPDVDLSALLGAESGSSFNGTGKTKTAGQVTGALTARVVEVLPNGFLRLYAETQTKVNSDVQVLALTGIVDPRAISADNSVSSTALFDARIESSSLGGPAGEAARVPWGMRLFNAVSPF